MDFDFTTADLTWAYGFCLLNFALGFGLGTKIKLVRKIEEAM